jgi:hypothetical protein
LYFNQNHIKSIAEAPCCNANFKEIQNYLAVNKFLLFPYNNKQYVIIDESSANLSLSDLINIDQFKTNASQLAVEHIVVNQGDITNGTSSDFWDH